METSDITKEISLVAAKYSVGRDNWLLDRLHDFLTKVQKLLDYIYSLFKMRAPGGVDSEMQDWLLNGFLILLALIVLIVLLRILYLRFLSGSPQGSNSGYLIRTKAAVLSFDQLYTRSIQYADEGKYAEACKSIYLALLKWLEDNNLCLVKPFKTNYEYALDLVNVSSIREAFILISRLEERISFGTYVPSNLDFADCKSRLDALLSDRARKA
jgi:hypothetical protein